MKKFYLTTPLYYVNARPHIGHSYTNIAADTLARFHRLRGEEVFFLTGTDEHGQKVEEAARLAKKTARDFCDSIVGHFVELWQSLGVGYDDFIRTTEERHIRTVQKALEILLDKGDIYEAQYQGWYCTPCETFWTDFEIKKLDAGEVCPACRRDLERIKEKNFFFRLSRYQKWLIDYIRDHPDFIKPSSRQNEVLGFLEGNELTDLCVTRPLKRVGWGIPVPFSSEHVVYVWFDALLNYISGPGYLTDNARFSKLWPADVHIIGKDILRPHAVYWPIILRALDLEPPRQIFAHGWWLVKSEKMSKSRGNIVDPRQLIEKYSSDAYRYFLLREISFGEDGNFSEEAFISRLNSDLANDLGNLVQRVLVMVEKYFAGILPPLPFGAKYTPFERGLREGAERLAYEFERKMETLDFSAALAEVWKVINSANKYIEESQPWTLSKEKREEELKKFISNLAEILRIVAIALSPFMPATSLEISRRLGMEKEIKEASLSSLQWGRVKPGTKVSKGEPLFPRVK